MRFTFWGDIALSEFEYLFSLFSLLLGFILIEVLSGLMRTLRARLPSGPVLRPISTSGG
jgi:hypothetical protein